MASQTPYRKAYNDSRREAFNAWMDFLKSAPCTDCGGRFPTEAMDWDHVRGQKVMGIGYMNMAPRDRLCEELQKCELVCANCHRVRTRRRKNGLA